MSESHPRVKSRVTGKLSRVPAGYVIDWQDGTQGRVYRGDFTADPRHGYVPPSRRDYLKLDGKLAKPMTVTGKLNPRIDCSARCQSATGPACECSCGGANHGI